MLKDIVMNIKPIQLEHQNELQHLTWPNKSPDYYRHQSGIWDLGSMCFKLGTNSAYELYGQDQYCVLQGFYTFYNLSLHLLTIFAI